MRRPPARRLPSASATRLDERQALWRLSRMRTDICGTVCLSQRGQAPRHTMRYQA
ncbi:Uncharacterised protein [Bordetella pertussis]|nr:Uncharacterised protein [Bordetella pertussis]CFW35131.1 Uncharacterised protein [Bordetella pertussis]